MVLMPGLNAEQVYDRVKNLTRLDETTIPQHQVDEMNRKINDFVISLKTMFPLLEEFKTYIRMMDDQKINQITAYTKFSDFLGKYEDKMFDQFSPGGAQS